MVKPLDPKTIAILKNLDFAGTENLRYAYASIAHSCGYESFRNWNRRVKLWLADDNTSNPTPQDYVKAAFAIRGLTQHNNLLG